MTDDNMPVTPGTGYVCRPGADYTVSGGSGACTVKFRGPDGNIHMIALDDGRLCFGHLDDHHEFVAGPPPAPEPPGEDVPPTHPETWRDLPPLL